MVIADEAHRTQYGFEAKLIDEKDKETEEDKVDKDHNYTKDTDNAGKKQIYRPI